jgi:biopolymer transport protein ExbB/TolQ
MSDDVIVTLITVGGTIVVALLGKISFDLGHAKRDARAVHQSINNRTDVNGNPISLSDRLDDVFRMAERADATAQEAVRQSRGARQDINDLFSADRDHRRDIARLGETMDQTQRKLDDHLSQSAGVWVTVKKLSSQLLGKEPQEEEANDTN